MSKGFSNTTSDEKFDERRGVFGKKMQIPSLDTRRGEDLEFTTDPNFFELIFNVLTIVRIHMIAPRKNLEY